MTREVPSKAEMAKRATARRQHKRQGSVGTGDASVAGRAIMRRSLVLLILCGLLAAGGITRVHLLDRSLWLDEAPVANSIGASAYTKRSITMTGCRRPHLFIALSRLVTAAFGTSYLAFQSLSVYPASSPCCFFPSWRYGFFPCRRFHHRLLLICISDYSFGVAQPGWCFSRPSRFVLHTFSLTGSGYVRLEMLRIATRK